MTYAEIFKLTLPVMTAYVPLGIALGILAASNDMSFLILFAISVLVYSGSAEFLLIAFIGAKEPLLGIFIALFLVSFRHFFYTLTLLNELKSLNFLRHYVIFALSDESFALLSTHKTAFFNTLDKINSSLKCVFLCALNQSYWLIGSAIGFFMQKNIKIDYSGIEFSLNALFIVLAYDAYRQNPSKKILLFAVILGFVAFLYIDKTYMLFTSLSLALCGLFVMRKMNVK